jgi:hypothetical protein
VQRHSSRSNKILATATTAKIRFRHDQRPLEKNLPQLIPVV